MVLAELNGTGNKSDRFEKPFVEIGVAGVFNLWRFYRYVLACNFSHADLIIIIRKSKIFSAVTSIFYMRPLSSEVRKIPALKQTGLRHFNVKGYL